MRIGFLLWQYGTFPADFPKGAVGGAESATWQLAERLSLRHNVEIICRGAESKQQLLGNIAMVRVGTRMPTKWLDADEYYRKAMTLASGQEITVAITCIEPALYSDRIALHMENELAPHLPFPRAKARIYLRHLNRIRVASGVSNYVSRAFAHRFNYRGPITTILNGADCSLFDPRHRDREYMQNRFSVRDSDIAVIYAGAIHRRKGLHILLDALNEIDEPDLHLLVLGGLIYSKRRTGDAAYLETQVARIRSMPNANFVGPVTKPEMAKILASSDIFVCPSVWQDPSPLVCAEAQASGLPVVGFNRGGIPELVENGETGLISEVATERLRENIQHLCDDDGERMRMARKARTRAEEFLEWGILAKKMEGLLVKAASAN